MLTIIFLFVGLVAFNDAAVACFLCRLVQKHRDIVIRRRINIAL